MPPHGGIISGDIGQNRNEFNAPDEGDRLGILECWLDSKDEMIFQSRSKKKLWWLWSYVDSFILQRNGQRERGRERERERERENLFAKIIKQ